MTIVKSGAKATAKELLPCICGSNMYDLDNPCPHYYREAVDAEFQARDLEIERLKAQLGTPYDLTVVQLRLDSSLQYIEALKGNLALLEAQNAELRRERDAAKAEVAAVADALTVSGITALRRRCEQAARHLGAILPAARRMAALCQNGETICFDNEYDAADGESYREAVFQAEQWIAQAKAGGK